MNIFVIAWFYPPVTTSEALVTYKLLANSKHNYYVCSATSNQWSYKCESNLISPNIEQCIFDTNSLEEFNKKCVEEYKKKSKEIKFDYIMTRSFPPQSQYVGLEIKKFDNEVKWIASFADPIANNPYEIKAYIQEGNSRLIKRIYNIAPRVFLQKVARYIPKTTIKMLGNLAKLENDVILQADRIIFPTKDQAKFTLGKKYNDFCNKILIVPHSFDKKLYPTPEKKEEKFVFTFIGHADNLRSIEGFIRAVKLIKDISPELTEKMKVRFVGNIPNDMVDMAYVFFLQDIISFEGTCNYAESLKIMQESDCLLHVDAFFPSLPGGSIFFAAKIADYLGTGKPILGVTGENSTACKILTQTGNMQTSYEPHEIAKAMASIMRKSFSPNWDEIEKYNATYVAHQFDEEI